MEVLVSKLEEIVDGEKRRKSSSGFGKKSEGRGESYEGEKNKRYEEE